MEVICAPIVPLPGHASTVCVGSKARQVLKPPPPAPYMAEKNDLLHPDLYSEAIRYPLRGPAHFIGPLAFSMASGYGHFFRVETAGKPSFPALLARCEAYGMRPQIKRFGQYAHSMGGGPRVIGTAGRRREKRHTIS